jgi:thioredoxin 1
MKIKLIILGILGIFLFLFAKNKKEDTVNRATISFYKRTWSEAQTEAKKEEKPIFIYFHINWCPPCSKLKNRTFSDESVIAFQNKNFINFSINGESKEGLIIAKKHSVQSYPTLVYLDANAKPMLYTAGYMPAQEFIYINKQALKQ